MHVKNSKNILTLIIGGRLKSENSFEHFSLIIIKDTVRSLSMFFLISIFSTKYLFSYNNIIIIRKPIH